MSSAAETRQRHPSIPVRHSESGFGRPSSTHRGDALAPARSSSQISRRACSWRRFRSSPLGDRVRLPRVRGKTEPVTAVHDRERRGGHPLHPPEVARQGVAADHDARLARLDRRAARGHRPPHPPDRARRARSTSSCPPCRATAFPASRWGSAGTRRGAATSPTAATWARRGRAMGRQAPEGLLGIHMNMLVTTSDPGQDR